MTDPNVTCDDSLLFCDATAKALRNSLILQHILKKTSSLDLLNCRLVSREWNAEATKQLLKRKDIQVDLCVHTHHKKAGTFALNRLKPHTLPMLMDTLENSTQFQFQFPCTNFLISGSGRYSNPDLQHFLTLHGKNIKSLELATVNLMETEFYRKLFQDQLPNLESLKLGSVHLRPRTGRIFPRVNGEKSLNSALQNLKYFEVEHFSDARWDVIQEIIETATNLSSINLKITKDLMDFLTQTRKVHLLKSARVTPFPPHEAKILQLFSENREIKLNYFEFHGRMNKVVSNMLASSVDTLYTLCLTPPESSREIQWPILHKVWQVIFWVLRDPFEFEFSRVFPNLENVSLIGDTWRNVNDRDDFPFLDSAPQVTKLTVRGSLPNSWIYKLDQVFPNVKHLVLDQMTDFPAYSSVIRKFKYLESLKVNLKISRANRSPGIDSCFTGLDPETCWQLRDLVLNADDPKEWISVCSRNLEMEIRRPILTIKDIHMQLQLGKWSSQEYETDELYIISPISGILAFQSHSRVQITVIPAVDIYIPEYDAYSAQLCRVKSILEPMTPYARLTFK